MQVEVLNKGHLGFIGAHANLLSCAVQDAGQNLAASRRRRLRPGRLPVWPPARLGFTQLWLPRRRRQGLWQQRQWPAVRPAVRQRWVLSELLASVQLTHAWSVQAM